MSESAGKHVDPSHTEPTSDTGKSRAQRSEPFVHGTDSKGQHKPQSASVIAEKDRQDTIVDDDPDDSSSSSLSESVDFSSHADIVPDDSASGTEKQRPAHRSKNAPQQHHQQQGQAVPTSIAVESGVQGKQVIPYSSNPFSPFAQGPQGVAGWVPPPAPYYGNAGYMPPNQGQSSTPYWQRPPYEEGKEMMPYPMWNPFAPGHGTEPPPAAPIERKPHQARKRTLKEKDKPSSMPALGEDSRPDGSAVDRRHSGKGKPGGDVDVSRLVADVDAIYSSAEAKDLTIHLEFDLFKDLDEELEEFNRLARMGNFSAAESFFESYLKEHMSNDPSIFVQYAEMLLEKGDFKSLLLLDGNSVFERRGLNGRKGSGKPEAKELLKMNWMLIRARALIHSQHELHKLRVFSMGMRITCLAPDRTISRHEMKRDLSDWVDWKSIYRELLAEQRIWDFRDLLIDASVSYDTYQALNAFLDHASAIEGMVADWQTGTPDESTELALLEMLSFIALRSDQSLDDGALVGDCLRLAEPIGNSLLDKFPHTVHSRPFIQWLISKAVMKNGSEQFAYLQNYAGVAICPNSAGDLPFYVPIRQENPGWVPQDLTTAARDVLQATLKASRDMKDYQTETLCLKSLALGTRDPAAYFEQLGQLQKKQQNMADFLSTCLTRYLICHDDESKRTLLEDLNNFGSWRDESGLVNPVGAAGRDVLQHALSGDSAKSSQPSIMSASRYSFQLPEHFKSIFRHLPRPRLTETVEDPRPPTETSHVEQHSESEDEPQESPENNTRPRKAHKNGGSRVRTKKENQDKDQSTAPGFYPGPWPNYGIPPYYPMNMMYGAQPPPPPESPRSPPPPPPAEDHRPNPHMEAMRKQLELLQAERREQEESKKRADVEQRIREDAERAFKLRMEEMQKAQEDARKEIELAKIAAERAARERIEEERKAEAERQRQHAELMAKAERDARDRIEKERKEEHERQRRHAETMANAERHAKEKYEAALKANEEHRRRGEEMREQMRLEMREKIREEMREEMRALAREERERTQDELERRGLAQRWPQFAWRGREHPEGERAGEEHERGRRRSTS